MFKGRSKTRFRGRSGPGAAQKVPLKGLFTDGVWHCNCDPRLPAQHFQTKNGGKNHGRWCKYLFVILGHTSVDLETLVYTCQQPQPTRCDFFLWGDEAKGREAAVVLNNSRSEPEPAPITPSKPINGTGYMTPQTGNRTRLGSPKSKTPYTPSKSLSVTRPIPRIQPFIAATDEDSADEFYDWPLSDDDDLSRAADQASSQSQNVMPPPETPRKAVKTGISSTPGKRSFNEMDNGAEAWPTPTSGKKNDDIFTTPATGGGSKNLFSTPRPGDTPTPARFKEITPTVATSSSLTMDILTILESAQISLPSNARDEIRELCNKQSLFTHGVIKGRDISRGLISKKDEKIVELQSSIEALQSERETSRAVIRHLRRELGVARATEK